MLSTALSVFLVAAFLAVSVSGQAYTPLVTAITAASCAANSGLIKIGNDNFADFSRTSSSPLNGAVVYLSSYDPNAVFGTQLTQMSLALGDNTGLSGPVHLRLGVYAMDENAGSGAEYAAATLVAQTDELTLYPSSPQTLYADLLVPVLLIGGGDYALGVWSDASFYAGSGGRNKSYTGYNSYSMYIDYSMPSTLSVFNAGGPVYSYQTALAATGCLDPNALSPAGTSLFSFCAYVQSYTPASSSVDYTKVSTTSVITLSGLITASVRDNATGVGIGHQVTAMSGTVSTSLSGQDGYWDPYSSTSSLTYTLASSNKVRGTTPNNLIYPTGAASVVDATGLILQLSSGGQAVLSYNAATQQYMMTYSTPSAATTGATVVLSGFDIVGLDGSTRPSLTCVVPTKYTAPAVPSCPAGSAPITLGDNTPDLTDSWDLDYGWAYLYGNVIYFRPIAVTVSGTVIQSLATYLLPNPNTVVHLRMGLWSLNGSIANPSWTLISQTAEQVLYNPLNGPITAPLPTAVTLQSGYYAIGVWFDQPVYTLENYWSASPSVFNLYQSYTSLDAAGTMPAFAVPIQDYQMSASAANGCVPGQGLQMFSFCAAFQTEQVAGRPFPPSLPSPGIKTITYDLYSGVLTTLSVPAKNSLGSYWAVVAGNASKLNADGSVNADYGTLNIGSITNPTMQRLYNTATTAGGVALDSAGLTFYANYYSEEPLLITITPKQIPYSAAWSYTESVQFYFNNPTYPAIGPGEFTYQPYTGTLPICTYLPVSYANIVLPPSVSVEACAATPGQIQVSYGDVNFADFDNQAEGNSIPGLHLYSNSFTAINGVTLTQMAVDILANTVKNISIQMAVYSSTGALLRTTGVVVLIQAYDQRIVATLTSPVTLTAGKYYLAVLANDTLNMATSNTASPAMAVSSFAAGMPATFTLTAGGGVAVPLAAYGCAAATHAICMWAQYYTPAAQGGPTSTVYLYQGLVSGSSNNDGSVSVTFVDLHGTALQRPSTYTSTNVAGFSELFLGSPSKIYPSGVTPLDASGLSLYSPALQKSINLTYSAALGQYVDTWGTSTLGVMPFLSGFNLTALKTPVSIPACSILNLPSSVTSNPAPPSCPAGQSAVMLGDDVSMDYSDNMEEVYWNSNSFLITSRILTSNATIALSQVAVGVNKNFNTQARMSFAVYDSKQVLMASTGEVVLTNPQDVIVTAALTSTVILQPATTYYLALWSDDSLYMAFSWNNYNPCAQWNYVSGASWPTTIPDDGYICATIALAGLGCTTDPTTPLSSPSGSSSDSVNLSKGAVAGIVVGCVLGSNLLLLICLCLFTVNGLSMKGKWPKSQSNPPHMELSEVPHSTTEENTAEEGGE